jgi:asparagine synthase (glutamine-hydrolysing)
MRPRFLVLVSMCAELAGNAQRVADQTGLRVARCAPPFAVLVNQTCPCLEIDAQGVVVGTLFHRHGPARAIQLLGDVERSTLARGGTETLLQVYWGGYLAVRARDDAVEILRDPSGALPCYRARAGDTMMFASDVELLSMAGGAPEGIGWDALGRILYSCGLPAIETALTGITTLFPGQPTALKEGSERVLPGWSPWDFVAPRAGEEMAATAEHLRRVVEQCVAAWASLYRHPLLSLSGGLDSSIVAASLARGKDSATCITMFTDDPAGDERGFARDVCASARPAPRRKPLRPRRRRPRPCARRASAAAHGEGRGAAL